jgi:hypothetical protein
MAGLLVGYFVREGGQSADELLRLSAGDDILRRGFVAGLRSLVWFAAYALFEGVPWTGRTLGLALTAGVAALVLSLGVSDGISFPGVAQPLWLAAGLALAALYPAPRPAAGPARVLALPLAAALALAYVAYIFYPVTRSAALARSAFRAARFYREQQASNFKEMRSPKDFVQEQIVVPLLEAMREDLGNARWRTALAYWYAELWGYARLQGPDLVALTRRREPPSLRYMTAAKSQILRAREYDPQGSEAHAAQEQLGRRFARRARDRRDHEEQLRYVVEGLRGLAEVTPTSVTIRYRLAEALFALAEASYDARLYDARLYDEFREAARQALELDRRTTRQARRLTPTQRLRAEIWMHTPTPPPPPQRPTFPTVPPRPRSP